MPVTEARASLGCLCALVRGEGVEEGEFEAREALAALERD